jgi:solute carrier family 35, member E1
MAAAGTIPGAAAAIGASVSQRQRRVGAPSFVAAYVSEGTRLVCRRQLRPAPVLASSFISLSHPARRRFLCDAAAGASSGPAGLVHPFLPSRLSAPYLALVQATTVWGRVVLHSWKLIEAEF